MHRSIIGLAILVMIAFASASAAHAQTEPDVTVDPDIVAPGGSVTVTITGAPAGETVLVRLGVEDESTTVDAAGGAVVTITAPTQPGETIGSVNIGVVDYPITITVQTTDTTAPATTTTWPQPTTPPPVTGLDDAGTLAGIGALLLAAGTGFAVLARRSTPAISTSTRGSVTSYRLVDGRGGRGTARRR